jgi:hypothetical protein
MDTSKIINNQEHEQFDPANIPFGDFVRWPVWHEVTNKDQDNDPNAVLAEAPDLTELSYSMRVEQIVWEPFSMDSLLLKYPARLKLRDTRPTLSVYAFSRKNYVRFMNTN